MRKSAAIYVIQFEMHDDPHVKYAVQKLREKVDWLVVVTNSAFLDATDGALDHIGPDRVIAFDRKPTILSGYRRGLLDLRETSESWGPVIVTGSHVFGPIDGIDSRIWEMEENDVHLFSPYWHNADLDVRLTDKKIPSRFAYLDFSAFSPTLLTMDGFWSFWRDLPEIEEYWDEVTKGLIPFSDFLRSEGLKVQYALEDSTLSTTDPRNFEVHKLVQFGAPCFPTSILFIDPLLNDLNAIDLRKALDLLRVKNPELYRSVISFATRRLQMRHFNTIADQYEFLPEHYDGEKSEWEFGRVAVFIHAFYAEMMPEFWELIERLPMDIHLFLTTATADNKKRIETFLAEKGFPAEETTVRVVEQNRGRDMSSLFITFRDVILSEKYSVALRLHSKRTPQVSRQVGESFKEHLFENLVSSPNYVRNLLDMMEREPDIGLVIPPVIHIGFGTLGHSWFNNRPSLQRIATDMGLRVPFDDHTPVTAYGTMYWFRTDALRKMFEWKWKWEDYNPEPHHLDGGLAHIQERLIGYCVQDRGYRVMSVMSPRLAARSYAKLEYKLQRLASLTNSGSILEQVRQLEMNNSTLRSRIYRGLQQKYGAVLTRYPASRNMLRPFKNAVQWVLRG
ncbi:rhamnan synthesis F family protein [Celeribacter arenosi]|uniref:Rhamnan synthesis protein F n=1 Tax=Celeribacter arenosi TaxID=792649 RepID=A0ABP7JYQ4_9RHOB